MKLNTQAVELPLNKIKSGMPKWLQEKLKNEGREMKSKVYEPKIRRNPLDLKKTASLQPKQLPVLKKKKPEEMVDKKYDPRNIFVLVDDQDILAHDLQFSYVEINDRLSKFVPDKVWKSQAAQRLTLKQKIELNLPSQMMQEQSMLEILDEISNRIGKQFESAWLIDGTRMMSPLDLPNQARIIIVSTKEEFSGIKGLEHFQSHSTAIRKATNVGGATFVSNVTVPTIKVKPQP